MNTNILIHSRQDAAAERRDELMQYLHQPGPSLAETLTEMVETLAGIIIVMVIVVVAAGFIS